ncbi:MAG TPA: CDP-alcohol phosphatidyltransferase family protein, partial [Acidobacteriota bacterium]|nr:CDP-alcohol phosphatidyltransferase family protein [Acidobacteriota bacterium]
MGEFTRVDRVTREPDFTASTVLATGSLEPGLLDLTRQMKSSDIPQDRRRNSARKQAEMEGIRHRVMTSANQLTVLRMVMVPLFVLLVIYDYLGLAILTFFLAGVTDMLDGLIARKFGQKTPLGTFLDPIADKLLLVSAFVVLSLDSLNLAVRIPLWLTITVISRDLIL